MSYLLGLKGWKIIQESAESNTQVFFYFLNPQKKYPLPEFSQIFEKIFEKVSQVFPSAKKTPNEYTITVPYQEFESDEIAQDIVLDFFQNYRLRRYSSSFKEIDASTALKNSMKDLSNDAGVDRNGFFWVEAKPEFAHLSAEDFKNEAISNILSKNKIHDPESFKNEVHSNLVLIGFGESFQQFYSKEDFYEFIDYLIKEATIELLIDQIKGVQLSRSSVNREDLKSSIVSNREKLMIDYSNLSNDDLEKVSKKILEYLDYFGKEAKDRNPKLRPDIEESMLLLIRHVEKYPNVVEEIMSQLES